MGVGLEAEDANMSWEVIHSMKPTLQVCSQKLSIELHKRRSLEFSVYLLLLTTKCYSRTFIAHIILHKLIDTDL